MTIKTYRITEGHVVEVEVGMEEQQVLRILNSKGKELFNFKGPPSDLKLWQGAWAVIQKVMGHEGPKNE